jgi:hypothetical protein
MMKKLLVPLALSALLGVGLVQAPAFAATTNIAALADLGVPAVAPGDTYAMISYANTLGTNQESLLDNRCDAILAAPALYGADAASFCKTYVLAETLAAHAPSEQDQTQN